MERRRYRLGTAALALVGALAVWTIANGLFPYHSLNHDEGVYLQQAAMLLEGQLNLYPPVDDVFQPWFFVENGEGLYPKYSPVPAAMFALGKLAGGFRLALVAIAAGNLALVVGVVREVFDRETGLVAGAFVLCSPLFLIDSSVFLPYAPTTLLNLTFAYGYLRADRTGDRRWAALAGLGVALAFFARPFTAVLFATPFIVHALWTLYVDWREALDRQAIVAALGLAGVGTTLGYNAIVTGSPWLFPYEAFAPEDGLGFGHRQILAHEIQYTPELALRANSEVVELFFTDWIAGGIVGTLFAVAGLAHVAHRRPDPRQAVLGGLFASIIAGNVYFWGNFNILGALEEPGDGLVSAFGPYYHFDLLLPTAAFAAVGGIWLARTLYSELDGRLRQPRARAVLVALVLVTAGVGGTVTADDVDRVVEKNMDATETYEDVYEPFEGGAPANSLILVPDPYGDWLNHPFQPLRNDPGFDGRAVYAVHDHPFETVDAFPDRDVYRFVYRGGWAPWTGSPQDARLQRVQHASGSEVRLDTAVGIPAQAESVTARVATDDGSRHYVDPNVSDSLDLSLTVTDGEVNVTGGVEPVENETLTVEGRDSIRLTLFVDYGASGGFNYRLDMPVDVEDGEVRALTPRVEQCQNVRACGGAAAYIPESAPEGVSVEVELTGREPNE